MFLPLLFAKILTAGSGADHFCESALAFEHFRELGQLAECGSLGKFQSTLAKVLTTTPTAGNER